MKRRSALQQQFNRYRVLYLMILPTLLYFILFSIFPLADGIKMSFQDFRFVGASSFVGIKNYQKMFTTPGFWNVFGNTLILGLSNVVLTAFVPMVIALSLNEVVHLPLKRGFQSILYLPHILSWVVVGGIWTFILAPGGLVNNIGAIFGKESVYFLAISSYARGLFIGINLWKQAGYVCILYLAAIAGINPAVYEAALIDGANGFQRAWFITVPELVNTLKVVLLLNVMGALRIFDQVYVLRNEVIAEKVDVLMYYVYTHGLEKFNIGYASAVSIFIFSVTFVITLLVRKVSKYHV
ncbi:ABC transporter permease subunit [Sediminispirochaeta smaragdinae]|uniref:Binding-protein-dependent transport systems inner membrane component n=1 Tax=Sediminispirochaeta smaragdinae (strain DSM 11293 / JCM 15392 / SEBR 4228) TaxID=573413 RepID=E1R2S2_SEDSS|nr:ABC transporter permease subunit [Sediminispirochaeta smaragdinae]ADK80354.1 binding-protein-dependent transport systems inner membrane component [Sediminispirochaeta smaragdinae DSM 11293]